MALVFELYTRSGCHLCEEMEQEIAELQGNFGFTTKVTLINDNQELEDLYGDKVPVLTYEKNIICMYVIDTTALLNAIKRYS